MTYKPGDYELYHKSAFKKKQRAQRNAARAKMVKAGRAKKGDGKHVDHIKGTKAGNGLKNLRVISAHKNLVKQ